MKFTVITVTYNCASVLEQTIQSVLSQDHPDVEYIIIDGASTDGTLDIIERYKDRITKVISEPDKGIYDAMNKGIRLATGDYINFMNAGDRFASPSVLSQIAVAATQGATVIYGNTLNSRDGGKKMTTIVPSPLYQMKRHGVFCHQSAFIESGYHKANPYDVSFRSLADYDFFRRAFVEHHRRFDYFPIPVAVYNIDEGVSRNLDLNYKELHRILQTRRHPLLRLRLIVKKQYVKYLMARGKY